MAVVDGNTVAVLCPDFFTAYLEGEQQAYGVGTNGLRSFKRSFFEAETYPNRVCLQQAWVVEHIRRGAGVVATK